MTRSGAVAASNPGFLWNADIFSPPYRCGGPGVWGKGLAGALARVNAIFPGERQCRVRNVNNPVQTRTRSLPGGWCHPFPRWVRIIPRNSSPTGSRLG